ncbi:MAG: hypothetical protein GXO23_00445 [Crenarchaeota archaeon]|nr:hypothetical protein [Thermoproteota archaeon]
MARQEVTIKHDMLRSELAMRVESFERDLTVMGGLLVLTPLIVILLSEVFNNSLTFLTIPLLTLLSMMLIFTTDRDVDSLMNILINYSPKIVRSYERFRNRLLQIYESLNNDEKILFKFSLCNRLQGNSSYEALGNIVDLSLSIARKDPSDVKTIENFRKYIVLEMRRLVYRFSTLLIVCMLALGVLAPLLYAVLSRELIGSVNIWPLTACIIPTLAVYLYLCERLCRKIEGIGLDRTLRRVRRNCVIAFVLSVLCCLVLTLVL